MTKDKLNDAVKTAKAETKDALQSVYDSLNQGQQNKLIKNATVKKLLELYGVSF